MKRLSCYLLVGMLFLSLFIRNKPVEVFARENKPSKVNFEKGKVLSKKVVRKEKNNIVTTPKRNYKVKLLEKDILFFNKLDTKKTMIKRCYDKDENEKDRVYLSKKKLLKHFGKNIFPNVPSDLSLKMDEKGKFPVYKKNKKGKIYYDRQSLNYADELYNKHISIGVQKGEYSSSYEIRGKVKGVKFGETITTLFQDKKRKMYYAEFMVDGLDFHVYSRGISSDEFVKVVKSLVEKSH